MDHYSDETERRRELERKVQQLQTQVFMLGSIVGIMLSLIGKLGWRHVEEAIYLGLADAAASIPPESEADWDSFMAFVRTQGKAVSVQGAPQPAQQAQATGQRR
jgi:hypothetical protein